MNLDALLFRLSELGVVLRAEGDRLRYDAPNAAATPDLLDEMRRHKPGLLDRARADDRDGVTGRAPATELQAAFVGSHGDHALPQIFNVALRITLTGALDVAALRSALSGLVARHESLRTRYTRFGDELCQEALRPPVADLPVYDLRAWSEAERATEVERISARLANTPFDLHGPVFPVWRLLRTGERRWILLLILHHSSCDGWGVSVLLNELAALYTSAVTETPATLAERPPQPSEYARWERNNASPETDERRLEFWVRHLDGAQLRLNLPTDRPRPDKLSGQGRISLFTVPAGTRTAMETLAVRLGVTPFTVAAAGVGTLFSRLAGQREACVVMPYANRTRREFETLAAGTALSFVLRVPVEEAGTFRDLVTATARNAMNSIDNVMMFGQVAPALRERTETDVPDRVRVGFHYQNSVQAELDLPDVTIAIEDMAIPAARGEIAIGLIPAGDVLSGYVEYSTDLWDASTIDRWAREFVTLLTDLTREALSVQ